MKPLGCLIIGAGLIFAQGSPEVRLKAAIHKEEVEGDLKGAIEAYRKISASAGTNRTVAAMALYRLGECYRKQGNAEARKTFERLVKEYGDQAVAADARARLAVMGPASSGEVRSRLLWDKAADTSGSTTADGRYFSFTDWDTGDLAVRDLVSGTNRHITSRGYDSNSEVENSAVSPDGKRFAYTLYRWGKELPGEYAYELHGVDADGSHERILYRADDLANIEVGCWSPDMKWIAAEVAYRNKRKKVLFVSPDDASVKTALDLDNRVSYTMLFSPDSKWLAVHANAPNGSLAADAGHTNILLLAVGQLDSKPAEIVTDAPLMGWTPRGDGLLFTREFNGVRSLYRLPVKDGKAAGEEQLVSSANIGNRFLGMTNEGTLIHGGGRRISDAMLIRLDNNGSAGPATLIMPITTFGLGGLSGGIRYSPDGKRVLYTISQNTILIRSLADRSEHTLVPRMARIGRVEWAADSNALLISGAVAGGKEGVYRVDIDSGTATLLLSVQATWLLAASRDGKTLYYRKDREAVMAHDLVNGTERKLCDAAIATFDMKLSRDGNYLAVVGYRDLKIVNLTTGEVKVLFEPPAEHENTPHPAISGGDFSADGRRFSVMVGFQRPSRREMWTFPVGGGEPVRERVDGNYHGLWLTPDGSHFATVRVEQVQQVWALENFLK